jgi:RNA polymerase sigma-70 factor (ECF subfamily)
MGLNSERFKTDSEIVSSILHNDAEAFKALYYKFYPMLIRFAWHHTYSMEIARDLVQEVFIKIWDARHGLNANKSIKAYLYKALSNSLKNYYKSSAHKNISIDDLIPDEISRGNDLELQFDIQKSVNNLPEKIRTVFMLSRYDGFNYEEIAEICDISKKAVEKRMSKAFTLLRKSFPEKYFQ